MSGVNTNVSSIKGGDRNESSNSGMLSSTGVRSDGADGAVEFLGVCPPAFLCNMHSLRAFARCKATSSSFKSNFCWKTFARS